MILGEATTLKITLLLVSGAVTRVKKEMCQALFPSFASNISKERNFRIFRNKARPREEILKTVASQIRSRANFLNLDISSDLDAAWNIPVQCPRALPSSAIVTFVNGICLSQRKLVCSFLQRAVKFLELGKNCWRRWYFQCFLCLHSRGLKGVWWDTHPRCQKIIRHSSIDPRQSPLQRRFHSWKLFSLLARLKCKGLFSYG